LKSRERENRWKCIKNESHQLWMIYMKTLVVLHKLECEEKNLIYKMKNQTFSFGRHWTPLLNRNICVKFFVVLFLEWRLSCALFKCLHLFCASKCIIGVYYIIVNLIAFLKKKFRRSWKINICHINSWGCGHCWNKGLC